MANEDDSKAAKKEATVVIKTTGVLASFSGEGFPTVLSAGTEMTRQEADLAFTTALRTPDVSIEEVTKL